ncbi:MAG: hypothetical protein K2I00_04300 [Ruminococcus sp.]|nr:hypothetical protein [Ruminococcus sp.]
MNKITLGQFSALMLINDVFALLCLTGGISLWTALGFSVGIVVQFILALPLIRIYGRGKNIEQCGKIAQTAALIGVVLWGGLLFSMLWSTGDIISVPFEKLGKWSRLIMAAIIGAVCVYLSSSGIKAVARSGAIAAAVGALCLTAVAVSSIIDSDMKNLTIQPQDGFFNEMIKGIAIGGGMNALTVLLGYTKGKTVRTATTYIICRLIVTALIIAVGVLVSGGIMDITDFPIVTAAQLTQPFSSQRIDSLFLIVFTVFAVYSIAVQGAAADYLLDCVYPKFKKYRCTAMLALMALVGLMFQGKTHYGVTFAVLGTAVPVIAAICWRIRKAVKS